MSLLLTLKSSPFFFLPAFLYSFISSLLPFVLVSQHSSTLWAFWSRALCWKTKHIEVFHELPLKQAIFFTSMGTIFILCHWNGLAHRLKHVWVYLCVGEIALQREHIIQIEFGGTMMDNCWSNALQLRKIQKLHRREYLTFEPTLHYGHKTFCMLPVMGSNKWQVVFRIQIWNSVNTGHPHKSIIGIISWRIPEYSPAINLHTWTFKDTVYTKPFASL